MKTELQREYGKLLKNISDEELGDKIRQQQKEYERWENSAEGIMDKLKIFGELSLEDVKYKNLIIECLLRLPYEIRKKVLDEATFIIASDGTCGHVFKMYIVENLSVAERSRIGKTVFCEHKIPVILLNFSLLKNKPKHCIMTTIAHEIAHFILGHDLVSIEEDAERKADDLCEKWGFGRAYKSYIS